MACDRRPRGWSASGETDRDRWAITQRLVDAGAEPFQVLDRFVRADIHPGKHGAVELFLELFLRGWIGGEMEGKAGERAADGVVPGVDLDAFCVSMRN